MTQAMRRCAAGCRLVLLLGTRPVRAAAAARGTAGDPRFGGVGYGAQDRPDLSNTQFFVDALMAAGVAKDDPAVQRALTFVSRCQNLPGESNDLPFAKKTSENDKGGFTYTM